MADTQQPSGKAFRVVIASLPGVHSAQRAFDDAREDGTFDGFEVVSKAIVERDSDGEIKVHEPGRGGTGTAIGAVGGGLLALLGGPIGLFWMLVGGGVTGGIIGHFVGRSIPVDELRRVADSLPNDSSGILLLLEDKETEKALQAIEKVRADILTIDLGDELSGAVSETVLADIAVDDDTADDSSK